MEEGVQPTVELCSRQNYCRQAYVVARQNYVLDGV